MMGAWAAAAFGGTVVIDELVPDADGTDDGFEWIELVNVGERPVDLTGWSLEAATSAIEARHVFDAVTLRAGERLVVGEAQVPEAQVVATLGLGNAGSNADLVRLVDAGGVVVDTVVYGAPNTDSWLDDAGATAVGAPTPQSGMALARVPSGVDTDDASVDFSVVAPTPGAPSAEAPPPCTPGEPPLVVINELFTDPVGDDAGLEWVELYNPGGSPASLGGLSVWFETRSDAHEAWAFPADAAVAPGGFAVLGGAEVPGATWVGAFSIGNGTDTDAVRLVDCAGGSVDAVLYGDTPNEDGLVDDRGGRVDPYGAPDRDQSLARVIDGADRDDAGDWQIAAPTPGAPNPTPPEPAADSGAPCPAPVGCAAGSTAAIGFLPGLWRRRRRT